MNKTDPGKRLREFALILAGTALALFVPDGTECLATEPGIRPSDFDLLPNSLRANRAQLLASGFRPYPTGAGN